MAFRRILIALDASSIAERAADVGLRLARSLAADVAFVHVVDTRRGVAVSEESLSFEAVMDALRREGRALLEATVARVGGGERPPVQFTPEGHPAHEVVRTAREWGADLIVLGTHGRSGLTRAIMGSTAEGVLRHAPCPTLVVKAGAPDHISPHGSGPGQ